MEFKPPATIAAPVQADGGAESTSASECESAISALTAVRAAIVPFNCAARALTSGAESESRKLISDASRRSRSDSLSRREAISRRAQFLVGAGVLPVGLRNTGFS